MQFQPMFAFWNEKSSYELLFHIATYSKGKEKNAQNQMQQYNDKDWKVFKDLQATQSISLVRWLRCDSLTK